MSDPAADLETENAPIDAQAAQAADDEILMLRRRHRKEVVSGLNLVAMMDMLTILLVYLITQYANLPAANASGVQLPESSSRSPVVAAVSVIIGQTGVAVEGVSACTREEMEKTQTAVPCLQKGLGAAKENREAMALALFGDKSKAQLELMIVADGTTPFQSLKDVFTVAGGEGFTDYRLVVKQAKAGG